MITKKSYTVYQVDSFTVEKFKGNPAGVVSDADNLTEAEMQLIARELKNSETAFIFTPEKKSNDYDVEVRFFTPTTEVPICGHATVAAHFVRAVEQKAIPGEVVYQKTKAGILPVKIEKSGNNFSIKMTQGKISFEKIAGDYQQQINRAIGLQQNDLRKDYPIEIASTGHSKVMIGITSKETLNSLSPNLGDLKKLSPLIGCNGYFVFVIDSDDDGILTHGRMFAPAVGIDEDPVTGNANGPLGAYLVKNNLVQHNGIQFSFTAKQGEAMKREGAMKVTVDIENNYPQKVEIAGEAVIVFKTTIEV
ncbi:MAG: PhzF family isomerase [Bacteroidota bacterium]